MSKYVLGISGLCLIMMVTGCSSTKVERVPLEEPVDVSGSFNDTDAQQVSEEMIRDSAAQPWVSAFLKDNGRNPIVIVGHVYNNSHDHINTEIMTKSLERALLNSGNMTFVASPIEREGIREEREDQKLGFTDPETIKAHGREKGADFILLGSVNSIKDETKGKAAVFYQVNLEMVNLLTNEKVWIGQKSVKKIVTKKKFGF